MSISTISFNNASRAQIMRVQSELADALVESTTNRHADVGQTLGRLTGNAVSFRSQETSLDRLLQSNQLVTQRLTLMEDTLETVAKSAEGLQNQLITGLSNADFLTSAKQVSRDALDQLAGALNLSVSGQYLFAGTHTDLKPLNGYEAPGANGAPSPSATARTHFDTFLGVIGKTEATVSGEELAAYFNDGELDAADGTPIAFEAFDELFANAAWENTFSQASSTPIQSRISKSETISSSVSANEQAFRDLTAGYIMLDLASSAMGDGARAALAQAAQGKIGAGFAGVTALRSELGNRIARVETADASLKQQKDIVASSLASLEEVDLVEASQRVAALQTQLEASYRVTGMIREINILDYL